MVQPMDTDASIESEKRKKQVLGSKFHDANARAQGFKNDEHRQAERKVKLPHSNDSENMAKRAAHPAIETAKKMHP